MKCPICGAEIPDGSTVCPLCGANLETPSPVSYKPESTPSADPNLNQQNFSQPPVQPVIKPAKKSPLGEAWSDISHSPHAFSRLMLLSLAKIFPVIGFFADGFAMEWAADIAKGKREFIPELTFTKVQFKHGLLSWIIVFLFNLAIIPVELLSGIPIIGSVILICASLAISIYEGVATLKYVLTEKFSEAFEFSAILKKIKEKDTGALVICMLIPTLIASAIILIIAFIFVAIFASFALGVISNMTFDVASIVTLVLSLLSTIQVPLFILYVLITIVMTVINLWSERAIGYWIFLNAGEWAKDDGQVSREK